MSADYGEASSLSAISSSLVTLFQFLPVPDVFSVFSMTGRDSFGRARKSLKSDLGTGKQMAAGDSLFAPLLRTRKGRRK